MKSEYTAFMRGLLNTPTIIDRYVNVPPQDQRYSGTITFSTPTGINDKIAELYRNTPNRHETMITPSGWWFDECSGWFTDVPPPYHHEPKLRDIKTSASVAILVEYMPDTTVRDTWRYEPVPYLNDILSHFDNGMIGRVSIDKARR